MHRLKEHSRKFHGISEKSEQQDVEESKAKNNFRGETKKAMSPAKQRKVLNVSPASVRPVSEIPEVCVNTTATVLPTIVTGLQTSVPLLVQAANGTVYLLSTPNISSPQFGGAFLLPTSTSNVEFLSANPTMILPSHQQQQSFLAPASTGSFYSRSQNESESLLNSALQAAVTASTIATTQNQQLLSQQQQQQLRRQTQSFGTTNNSAPAKLSSLRKQGNLVSETVVAADKRKVQLMSGGIKNVNNSNDAVSVPMPLIGAGSKTKPNIFGQNGKASSSDIVKAAMLENNIS